MKRIKEGPLEFRVYCPDRNMIHSINRTKEEAQKVIMNMERPDRCGYTHHRIVRKDPRYKK